MLERGRSYTASAFGDRPHHEPRGSYRRGEIAGVLDLLEIVTRLPKQTGADVVSGLEDQLDNFQGSDIGYPAEPDTEPPTDSTQAPGAGLGWF